MVLGYRQAGGSGAGMRVRLPVVLGAWVLALASAVPAGADPVVVEEMHADPAVLPGRPGPAAMLDPTDPMAPAPDGTVVSAPPVTSVSPDGWTLTVGAKDETLRPVAPLTTALSSRDYEVGAVFNGSVSGPDEGESPRGVLEVGYQIGCGVDMSTSQGVTLSGSVGVTPSIGVLGLDDGTSAVADGILPQLATPVVGGIAIGLKPGIVHMVPVSKKEYRGADPWVSVNGFRVKIDGCVGESFIRSYAVLTRSTEVSDSIQAYYGTTKKV